MTAEGEIIMRGLFGAGVAAFALALAAQASAQERVTVPLSTTMQRTCPAESVMIPVLPAGQPAPPPTASVRTFRASAADGGYELLQGAQQLSGDVDLRVRTDAAGAVQSAELSGPGIDAIRAMGAPVDLNRIAVTSARDIPERLVMNRSFAVGEQYYPPGVGEAVIQDLTSAFGLPFAITGTIDVPLARIETDASGARMLVFEGTMVMGGGGAFYGAQVALEGRYNARIVHDATTGLVRESVLDGVVTLDRDGSRMMESRFTERYSCQILPQ
ncbi:MAG: hypothetical protein AB7O98_15980 [Hyphomonadaceae bacterium]